MSAAPEWTGCEFSGHDFRDADLSRLRTERAVFDECDFTGADFGESVHRGSAFRNCRFERASLWHSEFIGCSMLGSQFVQCRMRPRTDCAWTANPTGADASTTHSLAAADLTAHSTPSPHTQSPVDS